VSTAVFDILARDLASATLSKVGKKMDETGKKLDKVSAGMAKTGTALTAGVTAPLVAFGAKSFQVFAEFDKTMRQVGVQTGTTGKQFKSLTNLAEDLGAKTSFSSKQAADAMLELAKGGMTAAQIKGGALAQTLTLAAAGGLELGAAAGYMVNTLNTFGLEAKDSAKVAAALAGGANASTASVESLGMALSQVGPGARNAGLSINDTVAALAAFDSAGIKGSDAGTSLKTMLARLTPQTEKAAAAMKNLGIDFTNADGSFKNISEVAQILQDKLGGLSEEQRTQALATIFGSDATRAATVLMNEGKKGIDKYKGATEDLTAAQKMAKTNTEGAAGSIEKMQGSIETAQIAIGEALAPAVTKAADKVAELANAFSDLDPKTQDTILAVAGVAAAVGPVALAIGGLIKTIAVFRAAWIALNASFVFTPIGAIITAIVAFAAALVIAWKKSITFRTTMRTLGAAVAAIFIDMGRAALQFAKFALQAVGWFVDESFKLFGTMLDGADKAFGWVPEMGPKLTAARNKFDEFHTGVKSSFDDAIDKIDDWDTSLSQMKREVVLKANIANLKDKIEEGKKRLRDKKLTDPERSKIKADITQLKAQVRAARAALALVQSKTISITVRRTIATRNTTFGDGPGFAEGTRSAPPGMAWVGEEGPELMRLKGGERIWPADESSKIAAAMSGKSAGSGGGAVGGATNVTLVVNGPVGSEQELENWLVKAMTRASRKGRLNASVVRG
jgi:TP901 family phage tail tape measure protein